MDTILVTDSLFIFKEHEKALESAGYRVLRIDKPKPSKEELLDGLTNAVGYILGGIETVTAEIIRAAPKLRAIAFTGSGFEEFIPGHAEATQRGIPIAAAKGANKEAVAEFTLALILLMLRDIPSLMPPGETKFRTTPSAEDTTIGVIGYGRIGTSVAELCQKIGFNVLASPRLSTSSALKNGVPLVAKQELLHQSDVITLHVSKPHGVHSLSSDDISSLQKGKIIVNAAFPDAVDQRALVARLRAGEIRAAFDAPLETTVDGIPRQSLIQSNMQTAFNTRVANKRASDWVTRAMIAMLSGDDDPLIVNPEFKSYR